MRHTFGLALAAGLLALLPTSSARAQAAYGYDSWIYNVPSGASYWYSAGYSGIYTDRTTASFMGNEVAPYRGVAPYTQPPFGAFGQSNGLLSAAPAGNAVQAAPAQPAPAPQRRPLILRRLRARR